MIRAKIALFDLGNTLFYDRPSDWPRIYRRAEAALWRALRRGGVRIKAVELYEGHSTLLSYYYALRGDGIEEPGTLRVLKDLLGRKNITVPDETAEKALRTMYAVTQTNWRVERDAAATLRILLKRGYRLGAVSNGSDDKNALEIMDMARMRSAFEFVITSEGHGRRKPAASIFQAALAHFQVEGPMAVMIGDSYEADILGAHALGMSTIWFIKHAAAPETKPSVRPDATIRKLSEIPALLS
jgi:putative hydrolase of the HAD superfamily